MNSTREKNAESNLVIELLDCEFNPFEVIQDKQRIHSKMGAQAIFIGYMRDFRSDDNDDLVIDAMTISHYAGMTEKQITEIANRVITQYQLISLYVAHRVGKVTPTSPLVAISALASHRKQALSATTTMLEMLKHQAPFWKKEYSGNNSRWVTHNTK